MAQSLDWALDHQPLIFVVFLGSLVAQRLSLLTTCRRTSCPATIPARSIAFTEGADGISFDADGAPPAEAGGRSIGARIPMSPAVMSVGGRWRAAADQPTPARIFITLKPRAERALSADQIIQELRPKLGADPGHQRLSCRIPPTIRIGGHLHQVAVPIHAAETWICTELYDTRRQAARRAAQDAGLPRRHQRHADLPSPRLKVKIDRDRAASLGMTAAADRGRARRGLRLAADLHHLHLARPVSGDPRALPQYQRDPAALSRLYHALGARGTLVPLDAVATDRPRRQPADGQPSGPAARRHHLLQPAARHVPSSHAVQPISTGSSARSACRPAWRPASRARPRPSRHRRQGLGLLLLIAIIVVYIVLGILYESFIHPLTILSGLPSAAVGALLTLDALRHAAQPLRLRRHDHAGRHRQEERDHDDRLRARAAARRRHGAARRRSIEAASSASARS